ncbi:MAG: acetoin dehydrogenase dihydrolipoyllysine-residue acetyltransferase subunit [Rhodoferax sp.]|nr:acetoin dehydrogenase dihydrolipoyllysine-residue acetyltransferase subunit [Rhodoferax sp.]
MAGITPIVMPKWGLSMKEGTVTAWLVEEGASISVGLPILEVETDKIANAVEAPDPGLLRRKLAAVGDLLPVKALLGVMAGEDVSDADIEAYVAAYVTPSADEDTDAAPPAYQYVEVQGIKTRYARKGLDQGTPVLFLHGFGGDLDNWLFNIDAVGEKAPVLALDLPGHGQSGIRLPGAGLGALATWVSAFLDAVQVERVHLVGHSMGGAIAAQLALQDSDRVASLTLIGSAGFGNEINADYIDGFARVPSRRELKPLLEMLFADASLVSRQLVDDVLKYKRLDGVAELLTELGSALFGAGQQAEQPGRKLGTTPPVLLIWGREDRIVPAAHVANAPPGASVEVLEAAGHMVQMERANEVNRLILKQLGG